MQNSDNHYYSTSLMVEQHQTQPLGPAMRHSLGVSLSGCLMGVTVAYSASALDDMQDDYFVESPSVVQKQWFSGLYALSAGLWGIIFGRFVNMLGKKNCLALAAILYFLGYSMLSYSKNYGTLFAGRTITGIALGCTCLALSPYISEISPTFHRGKFASIMQLQVQLGILIINMLGISPLRFRWNASICSLIAVINLFCVLAAPETPRWLIAKRKIGEARKALERLMDEDPDLINDELEVLQRSLIPEDMQSTEKRNTVVFFSKRNIRPLMLMCGIMAFQQLTAINAINAHSNEMFDEIGLPDPRKWTAGMSVGFLIFTALGGLFTDKAGRKTLLLISAVLSCLSLAVFSGAEFVVVSKVHVSLLTVALVSYVISFSIAWGSIPWVLCGELFTLENQGKDIAIITAVNWGANFLTVFSFPILKDQLGAKYLFLMYSCFMVVGTVFISVCLPETKGLSLNQIGDLFGEKTNNPKHHGYGSMSTNDNMILDKNNKSSDC